jgi:hypothetical protein
MNGATLKRDAQTRASHFFPTGIDLSILIEQVPYSSFPCAADMFGVF